MSADTLRRAAALMRERARVGEPLDYPSPWRAAEDADNSGAYEVLCHEDGRGLVVDGVDEDVAEHIASWHPAVALAVANLLDAQAAIIEEHGGFFDIEGMGDASTLAVARAYLGEQS